LVRNTCLHHVILDDGRNDAGKLFEIDFLGWLPENRRGAGFYHIFPAPLHFALVDLYHKLLQRFFSPKYHSHDLLIPSSKR
jgi:hypothetical protein